MKETIYTHWKNRDISDIEGEVWVDVPNTNGQYQASSFGRIKSWNRRYYYVYENETLIKKSVPIIMKQNLRPNGYLVCGITYNGAAKSKWSLCHRVICESFKKQPSKYKNIVHHIKNVRRYNAICNLSWVDSPENMNFKKHEHGDYEIIDIETPYNRIMVPENGMYKEGYTYIYAILDNCKQIVYVGKADNPFKRFREHKITGKAKKDYWINKYLHVGQIMDFVILKQCKIKEWEYWEKYFISEYKKKNPMLENIANGGMGVVGSQSSIDKSAKSRCKKVLQYNREGIFISEFESLKKVSEFFGVNNTTIIGAIKNETLSCNYQWKMKIGHNVPLKIAPYESLKGLPVIQYSKDGILIKNWADAGVAASFLGTTPGQIYVSIRNEQKTAANSLWRLQINNHIPLTIPLPKLLRTYKPVFQIMHDGSKVKWNSISEAAKNLHITPAHISDCIRNNKKAGGFLFEKDMSNPIWHTKHGKMRA